MERRTKENIMMIVGMALICGLNGPAGARVLHRMLKKHMKEQAKIRAQEAMSEGTFRVMLSRLKAQGIMENNKEGLWYITKKGLGMVDGVKEKEKEYENTRKSSQSEKDTIVIFDVPERRRKLRDYLRVELVSLGYEQLQKSVWIGGGPLPKTFMDFVKEMKLAETMHIFTIAKTGTIAR